MAEVSHNVSRSVCRRFRRIRSIILNMAETEFKGRIIYPMRTTCATFTYSSVAFVLGRILILREHFSVRDR